LYASLLIKSRRYIDTNVERHNLYQTCAVYMNTSSQTSTILCDQTGHTINNISYVISVAIQR